MHTADSTRFRIVTKVSCHYYIIKLFQVVGQLAALYESLMITFKMRDKSSSRYMYDLVTFNVTVFTKSADFIKLPITSLVERSGRIFKLLVLLFVVINGNTFFGIHLQRDLTNITTAFIFDRCSWPCNDDTLLILISEQISRHLLINLLKTDEIPHYIFTPKKLLINKLFAEIPVAIVIACLLGDRICCRLAHQVPVKHACCEVLARYELALHNSYRPQSSINQWKIARCDSINYFISYFSRLAAIALTCQALTHELYLFSRNL